MLDAGVQFPTLLLPDFHLVDVSRIVYCVDGFWLLVELVVSSNVLTLAIPITCLARYLFFIIPHELLVLLHIWCLDVI